LFNKLIYVRLNNDENNLKIEEEGTNSKHTDQHEQSSFLLPQQLELECYKCETSIKDYYLYHLLKEHTNKTIMIFTNSISHTKKLFSVYSYFDFKCGIIHSKMQQRERIKTIEKFTQKQIHVLFSTDIGARGLDIPSVDVVLHYHIPKKTETFVHRSGRTARANQSGLCISLVSEKEFNMYNRIMLEVGMKQFSSKMLSINQIEKYKALFDYTKKAEKEDFQIKKKNREKDWFQRKANECEIEAEDDLFEQNENEEKQMKLLQKKRKKRSQKAN